MNVTILGGGNGAFAAAGDLALRGHRVTLCELPALAAGLGELWRTRTILVDALPETGLPSGPAGLAVVTDDPRAALKGAEVILLIVPAFAQTTFAQFIAAALQENQPVLLMPGNLWGGFRFADSLSAAGAPRHALVGEAECMIYAARKTGPTGVTIRGYKHQLGVVAVDPVRSAELQNRVQTLYPTTRCLDSVVEAGLNNVNPFFHPLVLLNNLGLADLPEPRRFYAEGVSTAVARLIERLDTERRRVGAAVGIELPTLRGLLLRWYGHEGAAGETLHDVVHSVPAYRHSLFPRHLATSRYLLEDVPFGLVPFRDLARLAGIDVPIGTAVVAYAYAVGRALGAVFPDVDGLRDDWLRRALPHSSR